LVAEWRRSGLSTRVFAERRGVSSKSFAWWRWRLAADEGAGADEPVRLVAVGINDEARGDHLMWELATAGGDVLRVHGTIEPQALTRVLAAIARRSR
jgi:hypothetical protein